MTATISRQDLQAKINRHDKFSLVETLAADHFRQGHLPGAINLPPDQVHDHASRVLPDKGAEIVVYCGSASCTASEKAAEELQRQGYSRVLRFVGGKQDWIDARQPLEGAPQEAAVLPRDTAASSPMAVAH